MGSSCVVNGCPNKSKKIRGVRFHRFPKDPVRRRKWLFAIHREDWTPSEHSRICSAHFLENMINRSFSRVKLRENAVPIVFENKRKGKSVTNKKWKPLKSNFFVKDQNLSENTTIVVRSKMLTREAAKLFVKEIENFTNANFYIECEMPNSRQVIFHKRWICQYSSFGEIESSELNIDCKAFIDILVKKVDKQTRKNDEYLRRPIPLPSVVKVNLDHAHKFDSADALQTLNFAFKAVEQFEKNCSNGMTTIEAGHLNERKLLSTDESCDEEKNVVKISQSDEEKNVKISQNDEEKNVVKISQSDEEKNVKISQKSLLYNLIDEQISKNCGSISDTSHSESESESEIDFIHADESNEADAPNDYSDSNGTTSHFQNDKKVEYASSDNKRTFLNEIERLMMFNVSKKELLKLIKCLKSIQNECTLSEKMTVVSAIMKRQKTLTRHRQEVVRCSNPAARLTETDNDKRPLFHYFTVLQDLKENVPSS